ncbi:MAG: ABC transporter permease subunit [Thiotrichales bacterium]|nr:ABC transporter permease subunit [Thiotrichales bacterium]
MSRTLESALDKALTGPAFDKRIKRRNLRDYLAKVGITVGGLSVIGAVLLIMFFLFYVVLPLFVPAHIEKAQRFALPGGGEEKTLYYGIDEYQTSGARFTQSGQVFGFDLEKGVATTTESLPLNGAQITSFTVINELKSLMAFGLSSGELIIAKYGYQISYPDNVRTITPEITYPFGETPIALADGPLTHLSVRESDSELRMIYQTAGSRQLHAVLFSKIESMLSDSISLEEDQRSEITPTQPTQWLMLDSLGRNLYSVDAQGRADYFDLSDLAKPTLIETVSLLEKGQPTVVRFLLGDYSIMVGSDQGQVRQWFPVRQGDNRFKLQFIREFEVSNRAITSIAIEKGRKGFAVGDAKGEFHLLHSTAHRYLGSDQTAQVAINDMAMSPRSNGAIVETANGELVQYRIENEHPDVSMSSLWGKVWYEGYEEPTHTWQSSSASSDFEPKFSLAPLTWGTIKAALYSMLFAVPIAILAAIYTAFFMDKQTRAWVKPSVEMIEALPTVILGFLAGLWLAPYMESNLPGFFAIFVVLPVGIILFGYGWTKLPKPIRQKVSVGRRAVLMIPVIIFLAWFALQLSTPLENTFFNGDMRHWLTHSAGIDFDQRNAMVIGFAMGFALIPIIFSVAEDAIYSVPNYLVNGSLALGASGWQTMVGVVLPTASPGIFSAIMLGFGRGVGETMIVLMASGNTPLMNANLFEGMRTLAANLAVEMPEAEVASSHYRLLFLSGLVLFIFTFFFNTLAEVVRQRMRRKYGSL